MQLLLYHPSLHSWLAHVSPTKLSFCIQCYSAQIDCNYNIGYSSCHGYYNKSLTITRPLSLFSLSSVPLNSLHTNNISWALYLYTNSKQEFSTFKCEGGWRLQVWRRLAAAAGGWRLVVGGGWLPSLTFWMLSLIFNRFVSQNL